MALIAQGGQVHSRAAPAAQGLEHQGVLGKTMLPPQEVPPPKTAAIRARGAEKLAETREAIARAVGVDTRLSIEKSTGENHGENHGENSGENSGESHGDSPGFIYRAINIHTGEIVHEWSQAQFLELVRNVRTDVQADIDAKGLILDDFG